LATSVEQYADWVLQPTLPGHPTQPDTSYFVCGTPRSGSWFLCGLLASTGVAGRPHEWFWRDTEEANRGAWDVSSFPEYLARVRDAATTPNGVFGSKLMWGYTEDLLERLRQLGNASSDRSLIERYFPNRVSFTSGGRTLLPRRCRGRGRSRPDAGITGTGRARTRLRFTTAGR
jgi:hypothetical protein